MSPTEQNRPWRPDRPIEGKSEDALDRQDFAERLLRALVDEANGRATGVIVGITGPWGSGKSSILNLLRSSILSRHPSAIVVRFDPWLVSGRDDLIGQFFAELISTMKGKPHLGEKMQKLTNELCAYGEHLSPLADLYVPGVGAMLRGSLRAGRKFLYRDKALSQRRSEIQQLLDQIERPIIVLVDELDRVEDQEVRTVAQLVRSVADFKGISYVLAYDPDRVMQALGGGVTKEAVERGRAYLEKIVQLQIPIPIIFTEELTRLLDAELGPILCPDSHQEWRNDERVSRLIEILLTKYISTPRDVARLAASFRVLHPMLLDEVDWRDLLGYCALLIKAPRTVERIRKNPDLVCDNPMSLEGGLARSEWTDLSPSARYEQVADATEIEAGVCPVLNFLFPIFDESQGGENDHPDALYRRAALLTTLRLSLLPGRYSRSELVRYLRSPAAEFERVLAQLIKEDQLSTFIDRLTEILHQISGIDHLSMWLAFSNVLKKTDGNWISVHTSMFPWARSLAYLMPRMVRRGHYKSTDAREYFEVLNGNGDVTLTSLWLRTHLFRHGLFGLERQSSETVFLDRDYCEYLVSTLSEKYRRAHLDGLWMQSLWHLNPVYNMLDCGIWDAFCTERLQRLLEEDDAVVGLSLMFFGDGLTSERETIDQICGPGFLQTRAQALLNSKTHWLAPEANALAAVRRAAGERTEDRFGVQG